MEPVAWSAMPGGTNLFPLCGGEEPGKFTPTLTGKLQSEGPHHQNGLPPKYPQQSGTRHCVKVNITVT